jgi:hypothetical protein
MNAVLTASDEYFVTRGGGTITGWLNALYTDALGRPIDAPTLALLTSQLTSGLTRLDVALAVFTGDEYFARLVNGFYLDLLHRPADAAGLALWVGQLRSARTDQQVIADIASSDEYFAKLT